MNKPQGILLVLSGPSGAGKGTICARLREKRDHMAYSVSCTTRQPRNGEVDGVNYFFKTRDEFEEMIKTEACWNTLPCTGTITAPPGSMCWTNWRKGWT